MPDTEPYLVAGIRTKPEHMVSPPYVAFLNWCAAESIPQADGLRLTVWDEDPIRAVLDTFVLDENNEKTVDGNGDPITTPVTYTPATLPPLQGTMGGDPEYQP